MAGGTDEAGLFGRENPSPVVVHDHHGAVVRYASIVSLVWSGGQNRYDRRIDRWRIGGRKKVRRIRQVS